MDLIHKFGHEYCSILVFKMQVKLTPVHCETGLPGGNNRREGLLFHFNPRSPESAAGFMSACADVYFSKDSTFYPEPAADGSSLSRETPAYDNTPECSASDASVLPHALSAPEPVGYRSPRGVPQYPQEG